jgi:NADH:quinone reductase (non-electrogenic)
MTGKRAHVVVIGGGYAGTLAANHLRLRGDIDITLVNPRPKFVERIRLHQLAAGNHNATADYGSLLGEGIRLVVDSATKIDNASRTVHFASGRRPISYDFVIYAVGSTGAAPASIPGAAEFAHPIGELEYAEWLRDTLDQHHPDAPVTVVGAGLTGIETASELAEQGRNVTLVCGGQLAPSLSEAGRRSMAKWFARHGVAVLEKDVVAEVRADAVVFADGAVRPSAVTIWTAGFGVPALAADSGLRTDALGRLLTDETLTSVDDARIVAAGDCAAPSGRPLRMSCQAAGPLGTQAADTVLSRLAGEAPDVIKPRFVAQCVSLGRHAATLQFTHEDDSPARFYLGGRVAATMKEAICRGTLWGLRKEARKPGSAFLFAGTERVDEPAVDAQVVTNR